jgi:hypothetical protein
MAKNQPKGRTSRAAKPATRRTSRRKPTAYEQVRVLEEADLPSFAAQIMALPPRVAIEDAPHRQAMAQGGRQLSEEERVARAEEFAEQERQRREATRRFMRAQRPGTGTYVLADRGAEFVTVIDEGGNPLVLIAAPFAKVAAEPGDVVAITAIKPKSAMDLGYKVAIAPEGTDLTPRQRAALQPPTPPDYLRAEVEKKLAAIEKRRVKKAAEVKTLQDIARRAVFDTKMKAAVRQARMAEYKSAAAALDKWVEAESKAVAQWWQGEHRKRQAKLFAQKPQLFAAPATVKSELNVEAARAAAGKAVVTPKPDKFAAPPKKKIRVHVRDASDNLVIIDTTLKDEVARRERLIREKQAANLSALKDALEIVNKDEKLKRIGKANARKRREEVTKLIASVNAEAAVQITNLEDWWTRQVGEPEDNVYAPFLLEAADAIPDWYFSARRRKMLAKGMTREQIEAQEQEAGVLKAALKELEATSPTFKAGVDAKFAETGKVIRESAENTDQIYAEDVAKLKAFLAAGKRPVTVDGKVVMQPYTQRDLDNDLVTAARMREKRVDTFNYLVDAALRFRAIFAEKNRQPMQGGPVTDAELGRTNERVELEIWDPFRKEFRPRKATAAKTTEAARAITERVPYIDPDTGEQRYHIMPMTDAEGNPIFSGVALRYKGKLYGGALPSFYVMRARASLPDAFIRSVRAEEKLSTDLEDIRKSRKLFAQLVYAYNDYPEAARSAGYRMTALRMGASSVARKADTRLGGKMPTEGPQTFKSRNAAYDEGRIRFLMERFGFQLPVWSKLQTPTFRAYGTLPPIAGRIDPGRAADPLWAFYVNRPMRIPHEQWVAEYGSRRPGATAQEKLAASRKTSRKKGIAKSFGK